MTTNSPNPVDGDVQAHQIPCAWIIETPDNGVRYVELKQDLADRVAQGCEKEGIRVVITPLYANPPAQLLRPVELPGLKVCSSDYAGSQLWIESQVWNKAIDSCAEALRQQGYEVKND